MKEIIETTKAPGAIGPYVQAVDTGAYIFTSGQLGINPETGKLADGIEAQTHMALKNLRAILESAGVGMEQIVKTTVFVKDLQDFAVVNEVYGSYFAACPARSCVQVAKLPMDGLVEIECVAVK